jgi:FdhE protein
VWLRADGRCDAAGQVPGVRYLHCGLCATAWHHVRAVCITLRRIEANDGAVQVETCDDCQRYAKMLHQAKDMVMDPMADDLASLGLDMLVDESGLQRASNPLAITDH